MIPSPNLPPLTNLYYACDRCWHAMDYGQVHAQGNSICPRCEAGVMRELEPMNIPSPGVGAPLLCLVCAYYKPWGIFDSRTGVSVCEECRDAVAHVKALSVQEQEAKQS